ncbi:hypothetical protein SDC9_193773 [bioreactor metagenome]|uniref:Uncharacterized protein n=1 Tax=bioreactor metagenome TaxID=1076179 RepID=A0A645I505_9ZZZZ
MNDFKLADGLDSRCEFAWLNTEGRALARGLGEIGIDGVVLILIAHDSDFLVAVHDLD